MFAEGLGTTDNEQCVFSSMRLSGKTSTPENISVE